MPVRSPMIALLRLSLLCGWLAHGARANAADSVGECIAANERSLDLRDQGKLLDARAQLAQCAASTCPEAIQRACRGRIAELNNAIPSIVFNVKDAAGKDLWDVKLSVDGRPVGTVGATALALDPGRHTFRFDAPGQPEVERIVVLHEGEREKRETVVVGQTEGSGAPHGHPIERRWLGWLVGGVGVAAMGTSGVLALVAKSSYDGAQGCSGKVCVSQDGLTTSNRARDLGNVATAVFIAGAAITAGGVILWLTAPRTEHSEPSQASWGLGLAPAGAFVRARF